MKEKAKIAVVGGDPRQAVVASSLAADGFDVSAFALPGVADDIRAKTLAECVDGTYAVVLGVPFSGDGRWINCRGADYAVSLSALCELMAPRGLLLGGRVTPDAKETAARYGVRFLDYLELEEVNVHNAVPTAEGAISIAMNELPRTLCGARVGILGYGRVARALAPRLAALGAKVTVAARNAGQRAWCSVWGFDTLTFDELGGLAGSDAVFNTVPACVLGKKELEAIGAGCLIIDLASRPGGVDAEAAKELGRRVICALSLPGKVAPQSAGEIIKDGIIAILRREGVI